MEAPGKNGMFMCAFFADEIHLGKACWETHVNMNIKVSGSKDKIILSQSPGNVYFKSIRCRLKKKGGGGKGKETDILILISLKSV